MINFNKIKIWSLQRSLWTFNFGTSCCSIEFQNVSGARFDWERFGGKVVDSPEKADLLVVSGHINQVLKQNLLDTYYSMSYPKYVMAVGSCANSGGMFIEKSDEIILGVDQIIPVDIYVPGCPPRPESLIHGLLRLQESISQQVK